MEEPIDKLEKDDVQKPDAIGAHRHELAHLQSPASLWPGGGVVAEKLETKQHVRPAHLFTAARCTPVRRAG